MRLISIGQRIAIASPGEDTLTKILHLGKIPTHRFLRGAITQAATDTVAVNHQRLIPGDMLEQVLLVKSIFYVQIDRTVNVSLAILAWTADIDKHDPVCMHLLGLLEVNGFGTGHGLGRHPFGRFFSSQWWHQAQAGNQDDIAQRFKHNISSGLARRLAC